MSERGEQSVHAPDSREKSLSKIVARGSERHKGVETGGIERSPHALIGKRGRLHLSTPAVKTADYIGNFSLQQLPATPHKRDELMVGKQTVVPQGIAVVETV